MNDICRLCCSAKFLNNHIFDDDNALFIKMSLCLPIKVFKNDRLPQKICDKCSCKVNDFYQFCNESIEVQNRLKAALLQSSNGLAESVDLTYLEDIKIKQQSSPSPQHVTAHQSTQTDQFPPVTIPTPTKTDKNTSVKVKVELEPIFPKVKLEVEQDYDSTHETFIPSDDSDNLLLVEVKKKKRKSKKDPHVMNSVKTGRKRKLKELEEFVNVLSDGNPMKVEGVRSLRFEDEESEEVDLKELGMSVKPRDKIKTEDTELFSCCICFLQFTGKYDMLKHYRQHRDAAVCELKPPVPPPAPSAAPLKCSRCNKKLEMDEWSGHWLRHWEMDHRPYRCSLCEQSFKDPITVFKHGLTHKEDGTKQEKRFICDLCPKGFFYMRFLLAHRTRAHAEAASLAYALRCGVCSRSFTHINSLRRHMRAHSGERNFLCNVCGKSLSSKEHLKFHIRIHTGHKPYICKTCGKGFSKKHNLTLHERVHSGEKPHVCPHCGKAFSQRSTLVIHERYHSGARPYTCSLCGRGFVAKGLLSMHLKTTCI